MSEQLLTLTEVARLFDVPPWLVDARHRKPRLARLRWAMRRLWPVV